MKTTTHTHAEQRARQPAAEANHTPRRTKPAAYVDTRPEAIAQRTLADAIHYSPHMVAQRQRLNRIFGAPMQRQGGPEDEELLQGKFESIQRQGPEDEELGQGKFAPVQRQGPDDELQMKKAPVAPAQFKPESEPYRNNTGLPDNLKSGIETLSGIAMDHVNVHYNSSQPAQLNALAYTQGRDVHVAPGQEQHLPHEAWHVVQQAQGRVQPTMQLKDGVPVNDDEGLEQEADVMGAKAVQMKGGHDARPDSVAPQAAKDCSQKKNVMPAGDGSTTSRKGVVQRWILKAGKMKQIPNNIYNSFPSQQLRAEGLTEAELKLAREYYNEPDAYYTLSRVARLVKIGFRKANKGVRVKAQQPGTTRLNNYDEIQSYFSNQGVNTTSLAKHFDTKKHKTALDPLLNLVPLTEEDLAMNVDTSKGDLTKNVVTYVNQEFVPSMVRTPSMLVDITTSMKQANQGSEGFVSASKGSMFEKWVAANVIASSGKVIINQQGTMAQSRQSDGYSKAQQTLYDAKMYDSQMAKSTNANQWYDYKEIVDKGYTGSKGEVIASVCYVFPDVAAANLNTHLKDTNIQVAYVQKGTTNLVYV